MIFILEVTADGEADCWSRDSEDEIIKVHNILASIFCRDPVDTFNAALAGLSGMDKNRPCEVRFYRGIEAACAAALLEGNEAVSNVLLSEVGIVRRAMSRA